MNHKDNRRVKLTKQLLKDSLCELLEQESIHEISVRTLCENADVNRSTFYKYYDSLYDLLKEMEDDFLEEIEKSLSAGNAEITNRLPRILCYISSNVKMCKLLLNSNIDPDFPKRLLNLPSIMQNMNEITSVTDDSFEISYFHDFMLYGGYQMIKRWVNEDCKIPPEKMVLMLENVFRKLALISL
ncbi:MAG: TetR/AcrR family transcriptional regulator [Lachnospiraceae bacterium]|nr:TetR/AcrR family transcriptional regulator [Lachnospiraceae bacterium]